MPRKWHVISYSEENMRRYQKVLEAYPDVLSPENTFALIGEKTSFSRIGDGEFNIMVGERNSFNGYNEQLAKRLVEICETGSTEDCLVCLNNYKLPKEHPSYSWFLYDGMRHLQGILENTKLKRDANYGDAYFLIRCSQPNQKDGYNGLEKIKQMWQGKKVLFVCNEKSAVVKDELNFFGEVAEKKFLFIPSHDAFSDYDNILAKIKEYGTDWKIYMEAGATASVLAWDLAKCGYQALDMGDFYNRNAEVLFSKQAII